MQYSFSQSFEIADAVRIPFYYFNPVVAAFGIPVGKPALKGSQNLFFPFREGFNTFVEPLKYLWIRSSHMHIPVT